MGTNFCYFYAQFLFFLGHVQPLYHSALWLNSCAAKTISTIWLRDKSGKTGLHLYKPVFLSKTKLLHFFSYAKDLFRPKNRSPLLWEKYIHFAEDYFFEVSEPFTKLFLLFQTIGSILCFSGEGVKWWSLVREKIVFEK